MRYEKEAGTNGPRFSLQPEGERTLLGRTISHYRILDKLATIREVHVLLSTGRGRPRTHRRHSATDPLAVKLMDVLELGRYL